MSGLVKAKKYDWKDTNLALFGSDTEKAVKKESAESEPAWQGTGQEVGLKIWRIVKFQVKSWPKGDYGKFYNGDSYIVLNTYKNEDSDELLYDVHFWIGSNSSQDEYASAAYKTVELDTFLDDKAIQHREVQGYESDLFKSYFKNITTMEGGADTGFHHVEPESYEPRLLHFFGKRQNITIREVPRAKSRINSEDVFILDLGLKVYTLIGSRCSKDEKFKAAQYVQELESDRGGKPDTEVLEERDISENHRFYQSLDQDDDEEVGQDSTDGHSAKKLFRLHEEEGEISCEEVKDEADMGDFVSDDVFILDTNAHTFVWIGNGASEGEKKNGLGYAHKHLMGTDHPFAPVTVVNEGHENKEFHTAMAA